MNRRVTVIGEALVDLAADGCGGMRHHPGGAPFNVSRAIGRLGGRASFVGRISTDAYGDDLAAALSADGVELHPNLRDPRPTALALAELDARGQATYRFEIAGSATEALTPAEALAIAPPKAGALYAGGLGLVLEPLAAASEALVNDRHGRTLVFIDPNVRPTAIPDMTAWRERLDRVLSRTDVVKVSDADLAVLAPDRAAEAAAPALLDAGPRLVLLTLGERGAIAYGAFGRRLVKAPQVTVVDTIGAGDAFSGAWLVRWLEAGGDLADGNQVGDATAFAVRAAALSCERAGAAPPDRAELAARYPA